MPSDIAKQIVQQVYSDDKAKAIDSLNDALSAATYNAIQQQKINFAKQMGFDLDDTAQDYAVPDGATEPENVEFDGRMPHEPPTAETEQPLETPEEENETDS